MTISNVTSFTTSLNIISSSYDLIWNPLNETNRDLMNESLCVALNLSAFQFHDESQDLMSSKVSNICCSVFREILYTILFFIGFPSNVVNLMVFYKHGLKQRINLCLFCLSLMDITFVTLTFLTYFEKLLDNSLNTSNRKFGRVAETLINNHLLCLYSGSVFASQFISAVISGERCVCVVWPLLSGTLLKTKTIGMILLVGILIVFGLRFVVGMKYEVVCMMDTMSGLTSYYVFSSEFYKTHKELLDILDGLVFNLGLSVILCVFVTITTVITAVHLRKSTQFQTESTSSTSLSARNVAVTRMLIYLSIQFIVLNSTNVLLCVSLVFLPDLSVSGKWANLFYCLLAIPEFCGVLSSSLNFLIYYFFSSKYRETVLEMMCKKRTRTTQESHTHSSGRNDSARVPQKTF